MQKMIIALVLSVLLAGIGYGAAMAMTGIDHPGRMFNAISWYQWLILLALSLLNYVLRYFRWDLYIRELEAVKIPFLQHLWLYFSGFALTTTPGKAGEALRAYFLKPYGVSYRHSISALFVERLLDLIAVIVLALFAVIAIDDPQLKALGAIATIAVIIVLPLVHSDKLQAMLQAIQLKLSQKLAAVVEHIIAMLQASTRLLRWRMLYGGLLLSVVAWGTEGVGFYLLLHWLDAEVGILLAIGIYGVAVLAGALSFMPGGLGGTEAVMGGLLIALKVEPSVAILATLICRIATLWFAVAIGMLSLLHVSRGRLKDVELQ